MEFYEPEHLVGYRTRRVYHRPGIKRKLEKMLGVKITRWDEDADVGNGVFYYGFSKGKHKEMPGVHSDHPYNDITVLIYLTPGLPLDCGTSLWMHKETGLINPPTAKDARKLKCSVAELQQKLDEDNTNRMKWNEMDRIGYRFNRMVAYPSGILHSATNHYGDSLKNGRIYQTFRIGVDWDTFKLG